MADPYRESGRESWGDGGRVSLGTALFGFLVCLVAGAVTTYNVMHALDVARAVPAPAAVCHESVEIIVSGAERVCEPGARLSVEPFDEGGIPTAASHRFLAFCTCPATLDAALLRGDE